jgi:hypothetical protein
MDALDGNAIAGPLYEYFGTDMTTTVGVCSHCGTSAQIAELVVYMRAPGTVVRCRNCDNVVIILVTVRDELHVDWSAFSLEQAKGVTATTPKLTPSPP